MWRSELGNREIIYKLREIEIVLKGRFSLNENRELEFAYEDPDKPAISTDEIIRGLARMYKLEERIDHFIRLKKIAVMQELTSDREY